jgi:hypothetical protein
LPACFVGLPAHGGNDGRAGGRGLYVKEYPWRMYSLYYPKTPGCDSIYAVPYGETWNYNSDTPFRKMAAEGQMYEVEDLLQHYYFQVMGYMTVEKRHEEHRKMTEAARRYRSNLLEEEAVFMEFVFEIHVADTTSSRLEAQIEKMNAAVLICRRRSPEAYAPAGFIGYLFLCGKFRKRLVYFAKPHVCG